MISKFFKSVFFKSMVLVLTLGCASHGLAAEVHQITMKSLSYDPKVINVKAGDSVEWMNKSYTEHSATADDGKEFDTGYVAPQKTSKKIVFAKAGTYMYHCSMHGKTMSGEIIVGSETAAR